MDKEIRKETDWLGNEIEVIYERGEKVGVIRQETTWFGTPVKRQYDTNDKLVSDTRDEKTLLGEDVQRTYGRDDKRLSETHHDTTLLGDKVDRTYDAKDRLISETFRDTTVLGTPVKRIREFRPNHDTSTSPDYWTSIDTRVSSNTGNRASSSYGLRSRTDRFSAFFSAVNPKVWAILILLIWAAVSWGGIFLANRMIEENSSISVWLLATVIWLICLPGALAGLLIPLLVVLLLIAL